MIPAMNKLTRDDLYSLEKYAQARPELGVFAYLRTHPDQNIVVAVNRSDSERTLSIPVPGALRGKRLQNLRGGESVSSDGSSWMLKIPAVDGVILKVAEE